MITFISLGFNEAKQELEKLAYTILKKYNPRVNWFFSNKGLFTEMYQTKKKLKRHINYTFRFNNNYFHKSK